MADIWNAGNMPAIWIAGSAGSGKSTLLRAIWDGHAAPCPIQQDGKQDGAKLHADCYHHPQKQCVFLDSRGLDMQNYRQTLSALQNDIQAYGQASPQHGPYVAWLCIPEGTRRVQDADLELYRMLCAQGMDVVVVITKARNDQGFSAQVQALFPESRAVVRVRSIREEMDEGHVLPAMGLGKLLAATANCLPEPQQTLFASWAQQLGLKKDPAADKAGTAGVAGTATAAGAGAQPTPAAAAMPAAAGVSSSSSSSTAAAPSASGPSASWPMGPASQSGQSDWDRSPPFVPPRPRPSARVGEGRWLVAVMALLAAGGLVLWWRGERY